MLTAGGSYLNKEGKVVERIAPALPDDVFASEHEMERNYQAITISEGTLYLTDKFIIIYICMYLL